MTDRKKFRKLLITKKEEILSYLIRSKEDEDRLGESMHEPMDREDWANFTLTEDLMSKLADREIELLRAIDKALERIDDGTYGICEVCGQEIEPERLEILPWTNLCSRCTHNLSG